MKKVVLFDLDDTLVSEDSYIRSGYRAVCDYLNHTFEEYEFNESHLYELYAADAKNVFNRLLEEYGIAYKKEDILKLVQIYRTHMPVISFYDDVLPTIFAMKKKGVRCGIISDGYLETQSAKVEALCAEQFFEKIILTESLGREYWKPHPKAFELMQEFFAVPFEEMMYVGDNPRKDFLIQKTYPIYTVRIIREKSVYLNEAYEEGLKEQKRVTSLTEIINLL